MAAFPSRATGFSAEHGLRWTFTVGTCCESTWKISVVLREYFLEPGDGRIMSRGDESSSRRSRRKPSLHRQAFLAHSISFPISMDKTGADLADGCDKMKPPPQERKAATRACCLPRRPTRLLHFVLETINHCFL